MEHGHKITRILKKLKSVHMNERGLEELEKVLDNVIDLRIGLIEDWNCQNLSPEEMERYSFLTEQIDRLYSHKFEKTRIVELNEMKKRYSK